MRSGNGHLIRLVESMRHRAGSQACWTSSCTENLMELLQAVVRTLAAMAWIGGTVHAQTEGEEAKSALELGVPFADHAVLQQKVKVPVWGTSQPGGRVTVSFDGQTKSAAVGRIEDVMTVDFADTILLCYFFMSLLFATTASCDPRRV